MEFSTTQPIKKIGVDSKFDSSFNSVLKPSCSASPLEMQLGDDVCTMTMSELLKLSELKFSTKYIERWLYHSGIVAEIKCLVIYQSSDAGTFFSGVYLE